MQYYTVVTLHFNRNGDVSYNSVESIRATIRYGIPLPRTAVVEVVDSLVKWKLSSQLNKQQKLAKALSSDTAQYHSDKTTTQSGDMHLSLAMGKYE